MAETLIRILIVDDHPAICRGLAATLDPEPDMTVVAVGMTREEGVQLFREHQPDITLMDLGLGGDVHGIDAIRQIRADFPVARIIVFSAMRGDEDLYQALIAGAVTFLSKETPEEELLRVIRQVHAGKRPIPEDVARKLADRLTQSTLTDRETQVLKLIAEGLRNKEIAAALYISEETVQGHVKKVLAKLKVSDRTKAAMVAVQRGIFHFPDS